MTNFVFEEKGDEVISERHQKDFKKEDFSSNGELKQDDTIKTERFTDISFDDI